MYKKRLFIASTFLISHTLLSVNASAQDATVQSTTVQDSILVKQLIVDEQNEPIIGVFIKNQEGKVISVSDVNGNFQFYTLNAEEKFTISADFFNSSVLTADEINNNKIVLSSTVKLRSELKTVDIRRKKKSTEIGLLDPLKTEKIGAGELMKAACCNLSESFETTPSVDVGFTDAVSGYKQIQMLGLAGPHTAITRENIPDSRGLATVTGLTFTPGTFVEGMQLSKGAGSVVNGYEGTAGQINIEWIKPFEENTPKLILNGYQSSQGRSEGNVIYSTKINKHLSTNLLLHGRSDWKNVDMNNDHFRDGPQGNNFIGSNRWFYFNPKGYELQLGVKGTYVDNYGGQTGFEKDTKIETTNPWGYTTTIKRIDGWAKLGKVFVSKPYKSMGLQLAGSYHDQLSNYGLRAYQGKQSNLYANYIFQTIIDNSNNVIKFGASTNYDKYNEALNNQSFNRNEHTTGAFAEYSYKYLTKFNIVAGLRYDYSNLFGGFITPRLHARYAFSDNDALRVSVGRAQRTANIVAEQLGLLASNRSFTINGASLNQAGFFSDKYLFKPEVAWNFGMNYTHKFRLNYRDGTISFDAYHTRFDNQVVVDVENPNSVDFYNLKGNSYANSLQAQVDYELIRNLSVRLAYRFYDINTQYNEGLLQKSLVAKHRTFMNLGYSTKNNFKFDYTIQWVGPKRVTAAWDHETNAVKSSWQSQGFVTMNAQINKSFKDDKYEVYIGGENLTNFMQHPLIIDNHNPYGNNFDASLIWGPAMGRNLYLGFKLKLN